MIWPKRHYAIYVKDGARTCETPSDSAVLVPLPPTSRGCPAARGSELSTFATRSESSVVAFQKDRPAMVRPSRIALPRTRASRITRNLHRFGSVHMPITMRYSDELSPRCYNRSSSPLPIPSGCSASLPSGSACGRSTLASATISSSSTSSRCSLVARARVELSPFPAEQYQLHDDLRVHVPARRRRSLHLLGSAVQGMDRVVGSLVRRRDSGIDAAPEIWPKPLRPLRAFHVRPD